MELGKIYALPEHNRDQFLGQAPISNTAILSELDKYGPQFVPISKNGRGDVTRVQFPGVMSLFDKPMEVGFGDYEDPNYISIHEFHLFDYMGEAPETEDSTLKVNSVELNIQVEGKQVYTIHNDEQRLELIKLLERTTYASV